MQKHSKKSSKNVFAGIIASVTALASTLFLSKAIADTAKNNMQKTSVSVSDTVLTDENNVTENVNDEVITEEYYEENPKYGIPQADTPVISDENN